MQISNNLLMSTLDMRDILADNIEIRKKELGVSSQKGLATLAKGKVAQTTISLIERSRLNKALPWPKLDAIERLAAALEVTVGELLSENLGRSPNKNPAHKTEDPEVRPYEIGALMQAVIRLSIDDAKLLLPVVSRIADAARQTDERPEPNSNNQSIVLEPMGQKMVRRG